MSDLTQDEFTVLMIAYDGISMIPMGRWKEPILALTERGLMHKYDGANYEITKEGQKACDERNAEDDQSLRDLLARHPKAVAARAVPIEEDSEGPLLAEELKDG